MTDSTPRWTIHRNTGGSHTLAVRNPSPNRPGVTYEWRFPITVHRGGAISFGPSDIAPNRTEYIQAVEQLQHAWTPRYQRAVQEYKRFAYRIDHADSMAQDYFEIQENLTSNIRNPQDRRRSQHIDAAEREVYLDWRDQAFRTLGQAQAIMSDLHDMNIIITKQSLSAHFAALYEDFHTIPPAITMLHEELARFRQESDRIQQTFGVQPQ